MVTRAEPGRSGPLRRRRTAPSPSPRTAPGGVWCGAPPPPAGGCRAPLAPGLFADFGIVEVRRLQGGETVQLEGPGVLAVDGERERAPRRRRRGAGPIEPDGPWVVSPATALRRAAGPATTSTPLRSHPHAHRRRHAQAGPHHGGGHGHGVAGRRRWRGHGRRAAVLPGDRQGRGRGRGRGGRHAASMPSRRARRSRPAPWSGSCSPLASAPAGPAPPAGGTIGSDEPAGRVGRGRAITTGEEAGRRSSASTWRPSSGRGRGPGHQRGRRGGRRGG